MNDDIDDRLRWALRDLRRDHLPQRDLWPQVASRIAASSPDVAASTTRRLAPWALAASVLLALGLAWQPHPPPTGAIPSEARAMTIEYRAALRELAASAPVAAASVPAPAVRDLDRSAAQIRAALERDPDARFLLQRLRHTYSLRLALIRRAALA